MRRHLLGLALASLAPVAAAGAATGDVVVVAKPAFPPPLTSLTPGRP